MSSPSPSPQPSPQPSQPPTPLSPETANLSRTITALLGRYPRETFDKLRAAPQAQSVLDDLSSRARPPRPPPAAALTTSLEAVAQLSPASLARFASDNLRSAFNALGQKLGITGADSSSQSAPAGGSRTQDKEPKGESKLLAQLWENFERMSGCNPVKLDEYVKLYNEAFDKNHLNQERELRALTRATRGYSRLQGHDTSEELQKYWREGLDKVFTLEKNRDTQLEMYPKAAGKGADAEFKYAMALDGMILEQHLDQQAARLFNHVLSAMAAIEYAVWYNGLDDDDDDNPKDRVARVRFIADPDYKNSFKKIKNNYKACYDLIEKQFATEFFKWKSNRHAKETTARNRVLEAYKLFGPHILLDPSFSPSRLHAGRTSPSYQKLVNKIVESTPETVNESYPQNRAATLGIISSLDPDLSKQVRAFLLRVPSGPAKEHERQRG